MFRTLRLLPFCLGKSIERSQNILLMRPNEF
jgi:hypothetical protein